MKILWLELFIYYTWGRPFLYLIKNRDFVDFVYVLNVLVFAVTRIVCHCHTSWLLGRQGLHLAELICICHVFLFTSFHMIILCVFWNVLLPSLSWTVMTNYRGVQIRPTPIFFPPEALHLHLLSFVHRGKQPFINSQVLIRFELKAHVSHMYM